LKEKLLNLIIKYAVLQVKLKKAELRHEKDKVLKITGILFFNYLLLFMAIASLTASLFLFFINEAAYSLGALYTGLTEIILVIILLLIVKKIA